MGKERIVVIVTECSGMSVLKGAKDMLTFNPGEVIPVIEDFEKEIITETADGERRYVSKQWITEPFDFDPDENFMKVEDASDILVRVLPNVFMKGKSIDNLPANSRPVFDVAFGVMEDFFVNVVFGDEE